LSIIKIAIAQSRVCSSAEKNGHEIRQLLRQAKGRDATLVHFCEGALSGYTKQQLQDVRNIDFDSIKRELEKIQQTCKELKIWAVIGSAHELSGSNKPHNSLYVISDSGDIVNRYDKRKCSHNEITHWYAPGFKSCEFDVAGIKFSCALCIEIQFPEIFTEAEERNVDCVLFSSYSKEPMFGIQAQGYAATNNYWISMSVPANESAEQPSQFIGPTGEIIGQCNKGNNEIQVFEIDKDDERWHPALKLARPWRRKARQGDIYEEKRVIDEQGDEKPFIGVVI